MNTAQTNTLNRLLARQTMYSVVDGTLTATLLDDRGSALVMLSNADSIKWFEKHSSFCIKIGVRGGLRLVDQKYAGLSSAQIKLLFS